MMAADWMSKLSTVTCDKPMINLSIPGSHLSATSSLKDDNEIAPDQAWCVRALNSNDMIRKAVYNWSRVQTSSIKEQLEAGVRFLDVQVAFINDTIHIVHGLRGMEIRDLLTEVNEFINLHSKEVILIDINHFYDFDNVRHKKLLDLIDAIFTDRLIARPSTVQALIGLTLNRIWSGTGRVIVFYQPPTSSTGREDNMNGCAAGPSDVLVLPNHVWNRRFIKTWWPKTEDPKQMVTELVQFNNNCAFDDGFQVCQAIVTLTMNSIIRQPTGTFEARFGRRATRAIVDWLRKYGWNHRNQINVILADFIDEDQFCKVIIDLNH